MTIPILGIGAFNKTMLVYCRQTGCVRVQVLPLAANVEEATAASSKVDFAHKMGIASREGREALYWLRIIRAILILWQPPISVQLISEADQITAHPPEQSSVSARGKAKDTVEVFFLFHFSFFIFSLTLNARRRSSW